MSAQIYWRDRPVDIVAGETIAAALLRAGMLDLAGGRHFCGIGQCQNCVVVVDGCRALEACLTLAVDGMRLSPLLQDGPDVSAG